MRHLFLAVSAVVLFFSSASIAAPVRTSPLQDRGFFLGLGFTGAKGTEQTADNQLVQKRDMIVGEGSLFTGWRFGFIAPIFQFNYRMVSQETTAASVNGSNTAGSAVSYGGGLQFLLGPISLSAIYDFANTYSLSKQNGEGQSVAFKAGAGFRANLLYHLSSGFGIGATYMNINYPTFNNGSEIDISSNQFNETMLGMTLVYSIF